MTNNENITFNEYEDFIYQNTNLSREEAREAARDCWNKDLNKYEALSKIKTF